MTKSRITATYKPNADETFQVTVECGAAYPDQLAEARHTAVRAVHELIADALAQYRPTD